MQQFEQPIAFQLKKLNNQIKRLLDRSAISNNHANLTGMQYAILGFLHERGEEVDTFQRDVEAEFNIRRSTATGMLQLLEKQGYIRRVSVPEDARLKKIVQTAQAKALEEQARKSVLTLNKKLTRGLTEEEVAQFFTTLAKIQKNAEE